MKVLRLLNVDHETSTVGILYTPRTASKTMRDNCLSLIALHEEFHCPIVSLHTAGNAAHFPLEALLLLVVKIHEGGERRDKSNVMKDTEPCATQMNPEMDSR